MCLRVDENGTNRRDEHGHANENKANSAAQLKERAGELFEQFEHISYILSFCAPSSYLFSRAVQLCCYCMDIEVEGHGDGALILF